MFKLFENQKRTELLKMKKDWEFGIARQLITKEAIMSYFKTVSKDFNLTSEDEIKRYIDRQLAG